MSVGIVVGAGGGIGSACARALDATADLVVLAGRSNVRLQATTAALTGKTSTVVADITTADGREAIAGAVPPTDEIAWLILASGVPLRGPLAQLVPADIQDALMTNLVGPTLLIRRHQPKRRADHNRQSQPDFPDHVSLPLGRLQPPLLLKCI